MGIDVVALIAYDQTQTSDGTEASLAYWTIVGAYIVEGQRNTTYTLMEAVVYDISSRSLLFRAPGTSAIEEPLHPRFATSYAVARRLRRQGLAEASAKDMTTNLAQELDLFKVRVKEEPQSIRIEHKPGYTGGGALGASFAAFLALFAAARFARARK
jgi:rhombotail lipoprotein